MNRFTLFIAALAGTAVILTAACGGAAPAPTNTTAAPTPTRAPAATTPPSSGNGSVDGRAVFTGAGGCVACHTIEGVSTGMVGPDLTHIGTDAANRKPGVSARDYLTESIRDPEAFVPEGVERATPGIMTAALTANLSDAQVEALVEFLLAQK